MEKNPNSEQPIVSLADEFREESAAFLDNSNTLLDLYRVILTKNANSEKVTKQLAHMAEIVASPDDFDDYDAIRNFAIGEIFGYAALIKLEGEEVIDKVHDALKDLYAYCRYLIDKRMADQDSPTDIIVSNEDFLQNLTGGQINEIIESDIGYNSLPVDELEIVYEILERLTNEDDEKEAMDALRGYIFIRASLLWHEGYKLFRED